MKKALWIIVGLVTAFAIGFGVLAFRGANKSDKVLIAEALDEAIQAAREGRPGPVLDFISGRAELDGKSGVSRAQIADYIRKNKPDVNLANREPKIDGTTATIVTPVELELRILTFQQKIPIPEAVIKLERENATIYGVIPTQKWRVVDVSTNSSFAPELWTQ